MTNKSAPTYTGPSARNEDSMDLLSPRYTREDLEILDLRRSLSNVARALISRRIELGFSQAEVGLRAGTKQSRVSEIEAMKGNPRFDTLDRIARVLGFAIDLVPRRQVRPLAGIHQAGGVLKGEGSARSGGVVEIVSAEAGRAVTVKQEAACG